jgi:hypothetical protein
VSYFYFTQTPGIQYPTDIMDLRSDNMNLRNHYDTKGTIAMNSALTNSVASAKITFTTENFNNQRIHFQLFNELNQTVQFDGGDCDNPWILILNCFGINDE